MIRTFLETVAELPWSQRSAGSTSTSRSASRSSTDGPLRPGRRQGPHPRVPRGAPAARGSAARKAEEATPAAKARRPAPKPARPTSPEPPRPRPTARRPQAKSPPPRTTSSRRRRSCCSSALPASARPRSPSRSPAPWAASTCASRWAARATRPTSAATGAPTSAPCRAGSSKGMKQAGTKNPVFLLDEVDKLGVSYPGRPGERARSRCSTRRRTTRSWITTSGCRSTCRRCCSSPRRTSSRTSRARCSTGWRWCEFSGLHRAREAGHRPALPAAPAARARTASTAEQLVLAPRRRCREVITGYTREAGVRQLERELGQARPQGGPQGGGRRGARRSRSTGEVARAPRPAQGPSREGGASGTRSGSRPACTTPRWAATSCSSRPSTMEGKGELVLTGQLGDVMKESARAAWTYARRPRGPARHPAGGLRAGRAHPPCRPAPIPKDGPSAGVTMATALVSALSKRPVRHDMAMTGEITSAGRVLPIGGVKEKVLGGVRAGITTFLLPKDNEADLEDLPQEVWRDSPDSPLRRGAGRSPSAPWPSGAPPSAKAPLLRRGSRRTGLERPSRRPALRAGPEPPRRRRRVKPRRLFPFEGSRSGGGGTSEVPGQRRPVAPAR